MLFLLALAASMPSIASSTKARKPMRVKAHDIIAAGSIANGGAPANEEPLTDEERRLLKVAKMREDAGLLIASKIKNIGSSRRL